MASLQHVTSPPPAAAYAKDLEADLKRVLEGEVRFDSGSRALYTTDASNYRQTPIGVVAPRHAGDVMNAVALCRRYGAPVLARGGGTSLAGQCCNVAVVIDCSKYMRGILEIDAEGRRARVEPGCVLDHLRALTAPRGLTYAPDPATHTHCTFGGMIGNNSCGVHSVMGGRTDENVEEMEVLTYDGVRMRVGRTSEAELDAIVREEGRRGEIYRGMKAIRDRYADLIRSRYPDIPRRVSGYNLPWLLPENGFDVAKALVGSEGTLVLALEATVRLVHNPPCRTLMVAGFDELGDAGDNVMEALETGPIGLEGLDHFLIRNLKTKGMHVETIESLPKGGAFLLVEYGGDAQREADARASAAASRFRRMRGFTDLAVFNDDASESRIWEIRESGLGATAFVPGERPTWPGWEDSAVPPAKVGAYLRDLQKLFRKYGYEASLYGHFGQGCIHTRIPFDLTTLDGIRTYRDFVYEAAAICIGHGGMLSGEHGDGQSRAELLPMQFGADLVRAFHEFKALWDPQLKMNPGKVVHPYRLDQNLKLGAGYRPPQVETRFSFTAENGWAGAANRCVGVGKCRRTESGVMCPSYMVTLEERHSTRGRARTLFEMLQGETITSGWKSEEVYEALDLCLSCKGCKGECPVNVDMASYKAEFLSHYYEGRLRPRHAYSMGLIMYWAELASKAPQLANFFSQTPGLSALAKAAGGISQRRSLPRFAPQTFKDWFARRGQRNAGGPRVILWPDTFNNHFTPRVAQAAVETLEDAGFEVTVPKPFLCCGRPLYDFGMLDAAARMLRRTIEALRPEIHAGTPVVGLEPSCVSVFRDESPNLFPKDGEGDRLRRQTFTLAEFLRKSGYKPPRMRRRALVHGHCHQHAVMKMQAETELMRDIGLDFETLDSGCCGMAGSWGYEPDKYDLSMKCAERRLFPAFRGAAEGTILIADGFSCRSQVKDGLGREPLHTAQVLQMARHEGASGPTSAPPERDYVKMEVTNGSGVPAPAAIAGGALAGAAVLWALHRRR